MQHRVEDQKTF